MEDIPAEPPVDLSQEGSINQHLPRMHSDREPVSSLQNNALAFFDGTQAVHHLSAEDRAVLKAIIWLEEADFPISRKEPSPALINLLSSHADMHLSQDGGQTLLALVGLRSRRFRRKDLLYLGFSAKQQHAALNLAAILEIAQQLTQEDRHVRIQSVQIADTDVLMILEEALGKKSAASLRRKCGFWKELGYPKLRLLEPEEARLWLLPFPALTTTSGITANDTIGEAGRKTMRFLFAHMLAHEAGTRRGEDIEALHDMRVATRRLRAAFEVYSMAFEKSALKPHLNGLKQTGRALGAVRDLDVFMEKAQKYIASLPEERRHGLDPLLGHWAAQREEARSRMLSHLNSRAYAGFKRDFNIFLNSPGAGELTPPEGQITPRLVRQLVPLLVYERMASVRAFEMALQDAPVERLHLLRIELKKLRYTLEYFVEVLGKQAVESIDDIKVLQDHLGDLNDANVAIRILADFLKDRGCDRLDENQEVGDDLAEIVRYMRYRIEERDRLQKTFPSVWKQHFENKVFRQNIAQAVSVL